MTYQKTKQNKTKEEQRIECKIHFFFFFFLNFYSKHSLETLLRVGLLLSAESDKISVRVGGALRDP